MGSRAARAAGLRCASRSGLLFNARCELWTILAIAPQCVSDDGSDLVECLVYRVVVAPWGCRWCRSIRYSWDVNERQLELELGMEL